MARLEGVSGKDWPPAMFDALTALQPPADLQPDESRRKQVRSHAALEAFALQPDLAKAFFTFNRHVLWGTTLPPRWRHIVILRVAARRHGTFLWGEHAPQGRVAGITDDEIAAIAGGAVPSSFTSVETALVHAADELIDGGAIAATTWDVLAAELPPPQLVDVVFTAGCYETVAWFMRSIGLVVDPETPDQLGAGGADA